MCKMAAIKDTTWAKDILIFKDSEGRTVKRWTDTKRDWRWYWRDDLEHPCVSVTTVLGMIKNKKFIEWVGRICAQQRHPDAYKWVADAAAKKGTEMHEVLENYDLGIKQGKKGSADVHQDMLRQYIEWENDQQLETLMLEQSMIDPELGIAGTVDKIVVCNGCRELWDYKSGGSWKYDVKASWQMATYAAMAAKLHKLHIQRLRVLHTDLKTGVFNPEGRIIQSRKSIEGCFDSFKHLFTVWKRYNHTTLLRYGIHDPVDYSTVYKWPIEKVFDLEDDQEKQPVE